MRTKKTITIRTNKTIVTIMSLILSACVSLAGSAAAQDGLVSTMELMEGIAAIDGIRIVKPADRSGTVYTEDYSASQVLEIIRPNMVPVTIGRLSTSCTCITASMEKKTFAQGERAFIEVRNVKPSKPGGATYAVWAQMTSPYRAALQFEMRVLSDRTPGDPVPETAPAPAAVTAPEEKQAAPATPAEVIPATDSTPEIIVPVADETTKVLPSASVSIPRSATIVVDSSSSSSSGSGVFRYENIAPYKPKSSEERAAAEASAAAEKEAVPVSGDSE